MNTSGYVMQASPNPDGHVFMPINLNNTTYSAGAGNTTTAVNGVFGLNIAPNGQANCSIVLSPFLLRYGMQDDSQMLFGQNNGQGGAQALPLLPGTNFNSPYSTQSRPPVPSANYFGKYTGNAAVIPKGIGIRNMSLIYQVTGAAATTLTMGLVKIQYTNGAALVATNLLAVAANGLSTAVTAQPTVTTTALPTANQIMLTPRFSQYTALVNVNTPANCNVNLFGLAFDVFYNFN